MHLPAAIPHSYTEVKNIYYLEMLIHLTYPKVIVINPQIHCD